MEISVELDESLVDELDEEAQLQGFDDREAYLRWIVANRPMSELATSQAPVVASRLSELEERVKLVERQLDLDAPTDPAADLGDGSVSSSGDLGDGDGASLETSGGASLDESAPDEDEVDEEDEDAADDDEIADAIGDIDFEDENE